MADIIHQLYQQQCYPPMSYPLADPAFSAVAERVSLGLVIELAVDVGWVHFTGRSKRPLLVVLR